MSRGVIITEETWDRVRAVVQWVESHRDSILRQPEVSESEEPVLVHITGSTGSSATAGITTYDGSTFTDLSGVSVNAVSMNGEYLKNGSYYPAHRIGPNSDFVASPGAIRVGAYYGVYRLSFSGSGFTVTETATGHATVTYTETNVIIVDGWGTDEIETDATTGIYSTNDGVEPTTTTLHLSAAGTGAWGVVNTAGQEFAGAKTFQDQIYIRTNVGGSPAWMTGEWLQLNGGGAVMNGAGVTLVTMLTRTGAPYTHGGSSHSGLALGNGGVSIYRGFWDGFSTTLDSSNSYNIDLTVQGKYCVAYYDGAAWQGANGQTGTIGPGATCRGGIVVGSGSTGLTGTVP